MLEGIQITIVRFLQGTLVVAGVLAAIRGSWTVLFASSITLAVIFLPAVLGRNFKLNLPVGFHFIVTLFIYATLFLGEAGDFYERFWWWDVLLHTGSAIVFGIVGFMILYTLYDTNRFVARPFMIGLFSFAFAVDIGAMWEIFEFTMDSFFGLNMQKSGLIDTMWDLIIDSIGALIASTVGYYFIKERGKGFLSRAIKKFTASSPQFQR